MSPSSRERDYARRRHASWTQRQQARADERRARRRTALVALGAFLVAVAIIAVIAVVAGTRSGGSSTASSPSTKALPANACPSPTSTPPSKPAQFASAPAASIAQARTWTGTITTSCGAIGVSLDGAKAPHAVASFVTLAGKGFFDHTRCHRLTTEVKGQGIDVLQCGDPTGTGTGGPGYSFGPVEDAPANNTYPAGTIAMSRQADNATSQGSQFFLVYGDSTIPSDSAGGYTVLGTITSGLDVVKRVAASGVTGGGSDGAPKTPISIEQVSVQ